MQEKTKPRKHGRYWTLLYWDDDYSKGQKKRIRRRKRLAPHHGQSRCPEQVRLEAQKFLVAINQRQSSPESTWTVAYFIENRYFPTIEKTLRPSTVLNYKTSVYERHLKRRLANIRLANSGQMTAGRSCAK